jgi:hypothetical protein
VDIDIYATHDFQGVARELYFVSSASEDIGRYVVAAAAQPAPPPGLPAFVDVESITYVFNEVDADVDLTELEQVKSLVIQGVDFTIYAETGLTGDPARIYVATADGATIGQYVQSSLVDSLLRPATPEAAE